MILYVIISCAASALAVAAVLYILHGIGLSTMLRRSGFKKPWFAFVPFCRVFALGCLADQCRDIMPPKKRGHKLLYFAIGFAALNIAYLVFYWTKIAAPTVEFFKAVDVLFIKTIEAGGNLPTDEFLAIADVYSKSVEALITKPLEVLSMLASISAMIYEVYNIFVLMRVYRIFAPNSSFVLTLLSIFIEPAQSIIFFVIRKKPLRNMRWQEPEQSFDTPPFSM